MNEHEPHYTEHGFGKESNPSPSGTMKSQPGLSMHELHRMLKSKIAEEIPEDFHLFLTGDCITFLTDRHDCLEKEQLSGSPERVAFPEKEQFQTFSVSDCRALMLSLTDHGITPVWAEIQPTGFSQANIYWNSLGEYKRAAWNQAARIAAWEMQILERRASQKPIHEYWNRKLAAAFTEMEEKLSEEVPKAKKVMSLAGQEYIMRGGDWMKKPDGTPSDYRVVSCSQGEKPIVSVPLNQCVSVMRDEMARNPKVVTKIMTQPLWTERKTAELRSDSDIKDWVWNEITTP